MRLPRRLSAAPAEGGFAIIEVLVSGVVAVIAVAGVMSLMGASVKTAADQRNHTISYSIAQEDQARIRTMRVPTLKTLATSAGEKREFLVDGLKYKVISRAFLVSDATSAVSCGTSADYFRTESEVTWTNMRAATPPTVIRSIISPPSESLKPKAGNLSVFVEDGFGNGVSSVGISGTGPQAISGSTDVSGCALFTEVTEGKYTITPSGTNLVDKDGKTPSGTVISVNPESTATLTLLLAQKGSVPLKFTTRTYNNTIVANKTTHFIAYNTEMTTAKVFESTTAFSEKTAESLFPFGTTDSFYAGRCTTNNPVTGEAIANVLVPAGASALTQTIQMPALLAKVWTGKNSSNPGSAFANAEVVVEDTTCDDSDGDPVRKVFTTNSSGQLSEPGLPWGIYDLCADNNGSTSSTRRRQTIDARAVKTTTVGTTVNFYLGSGSGTVSESGRC